MWLIDDPWHRVGHRQACLEKVDLRASEHPFPQFALARLEDVIDQIALFLAQFLVSSDEIAQLSSTVASTLEKLLAKAAAELDADADSVQELLQLAADSQGEFEVPIPLERASAVREQVQAKLGGLDDGFVGTIEAYMKKADGDGQQGARLAQEAGLEHLGDLELRRGMEHLEGHGAVRGQAVGPIDPAHRALAGRAWHPPHRPLPPARTHSPFYESKAACVRHPTGCQARRSRS